MVSILIFQVVLGCTVWLSQYGVPLWWSDWVASWHLALNSPDPVFIVGSVAHVIGGMITFLIAISLGISSGRLGDPSGAYDRITTKLGKFPASGPGRSCIGMAGHPCRAVHVGTAEYPPCSCRGCLYWRGDYPSDRVILRHFLCQAAAERCPTGVGCHSKVCIRSRLIWGNGCGWCGLSCRAGLPRSCYLGRARDDMPND